MKQPKLLPGRGYDVMVWNVVRLVHSGVALKEAFRIVLAHAGLKVFPPRPRDPHCRPSLPLPTFETLDPDTETIH